MQLVTTSINHNVVNCWMKLTIKMWYWYINHSISVEYYELPLWSTTSTIPIHDMVLYYLILDGINVPTASIEKFRDILFQKNLLKHSILCWVKRILSLYSFSKSLDLYDAAPFARLHRNRMTYVPHFDRNHSAIYNITINISHKWLHTRYYSLRSAYHHVINSPRVGLGLLDTAEISRIS